jgi:hypothetical protein
MWLMIGCRPGHESKRAFNNLAGPVEGSMGQVSVTSRGRKAATPVPVAPEPSGTLIPAATEDRAQFTRKRAADSAADEVMRVATKKAKMVAALKTA